MTTDPYPHWLFDNSPIPDPLGHGERAVQFLKSLIHPKTGRPFELHLWQERIVRRIYGPVHTADVIDADGVLIHRAGEREVRNVVMCVPRGARKTTLGAGLALYHAVSHARVPGGQVILAAYDRAQARIAYDEALGLVHACPPLQAATRIRGSTHEILHPKSRSVLKAVSSDANAQNGKTPNFVLFDEIHAWNKRDLYDILRTGLGKTANTLSLVISQAGRGQDTLAHEVFDYARRVARGEIDDPGTLPILFETAPDADWLDEKVWFRANPGLKLGYPNLASLRQEAREAQHRPALRDKFKNDHLCIWLDRSSSPFVEMSVYDEGADPFDLADMEGRPCWIGVDLSSSRDLTSIVAAWPRDDGGFYVHPWFFCPDDNVADRENLSGAPYRRWREQGAIITTPGTTIDLATVKQTIRDIAKRFDVRDIGFDPYLSHGILGELQDEGLPVREFHQRPSTMMPAIATLDRVVNAKQLQHGGHEILRWNFANVEVETNTMGHKVRFSKGTRRDLCIDGAVATAMAVQLAHTGDDGRMIYLDKKARPNGFIVF
ncbi:terminase large subunit [Mongoliimonas terrestris]|uniref:terminase large subunit n=1 Tax=Mongoliimonas terrestris TaxID=1709001 RepID=UPI00094988E0|nr:terminase TerL endonuclease subunit [Mongoliimonas terrestris]